jgi:hypothetical protein
VPTHLYGLPCDIDRILDIAARHNLIVLGRLRARARRDLQGRPVGTFGTGALFSFPDAEAAQLLRRRHGARATTRAGGEGAADRGRAAVAIRETRVGSAAGGTPAADLREARVFAVSLFPVLWASSFIGARPDVYLWEKVRPLQPLPDAYTERFPNVQAVIGLEALKRLDGWTAEVRANAAYMNRALSAVPGVQVPRVPPGRTHVYYQYCVYGPPAEAARRAGGSVREARHRHRNTARRRPPDMPLFEGARAEAEGARLTTRAIQVPIYAGLSRRRMERVAATVGGVLSRASRPAGSGRSGARRRQPSDGGTRLKGPRCTSEIRTPRTSG